MLLESKMDSMKNDWTQFETGMKKGMIGGVKFTGGGDAKGNPSKTSKTKSSFFKYQPQKLGKKVSEDSVELDSSVESENDYAYTKFSRQDTETSKISNAINLRRETVLGDVSESEELVTDEEFNESPTSMAQKK